MRSTIAFTLLTLAPGVVVLGFFGVSLWLGWPSGPHGAVLTLPAAAVAATLLALVFLLGRAAPPAGSPHRRLRGLRWTDGRHVLREGTTEAGRVLAAHNWKLLGALGYYAFDNAALWAAFRAYGHAPPIGVIVMGYLVGSLGAVVPVPAGLGAVDGGLIGALVVYGAPAAPAAGAVVLYRGISLGLAVSLSASAWTVTQPSRGVRAHAWAAAVRLAPASRRSRRAHNSDSSQPTARRRERLAPQNGNGSTRVSARVRVRAHSAATQGPHSAGS